ncbi:MAG: hypothetical protein LBT27_08445 [Prevotellaceae bacterium]|jgi:hypothetical protein|nr:hypothetical protein [Prevotellaceae bacterium]
MKKLALLTIALISVVFTSCEKSTDYYIPLAGSKWETTVDNSAIILHFETENVCTIGIYGPSYVLNVTTYRYRLASSFDSMSGDLHIYQLDDGSYCYTGYFENKMIRLKSIPKLPDLIFKKQK